VEKQVSKDDQGESCSSGAVARYTEDWIEKTAALSKLLPLPRAARHSAIRTIASTFF
jgi:hypothetical protein